MATSANSTAANGVTRGKLILIGVLAVVFALVIYWNYFRDGAARGAAVSLADPPPAKRPVASAPAAGQRPARPSPEAAGRAAPAGTAPPTAPGRGDLQPSARRRPWPQFKLASVLAYDPFAVPSQFPQPSPSPAAGAADDSEQLKAAQERAAAEAARAATVEEINKQGVTLVLLNGKEYVAKIGDKEVRVGDMYKGFRVVDIDLHGVTLEEVGPP
jgi:hypothetical protein